MRFRLRPVLAATAVLAAAMTTLIPARQAMAADPPVDDYPPKVAPICASTTRPGVDAFRAMILERVGGGNGRTNGPCSETTSDHREGRAWDWMNDANNPADAARVQSVIGWLLASDGTQRNVMARRLGIRYIIWNRKIITLTGDSAAWQNYSCDGSASSCHTNHVHFSFSPAGGSKQTSWFTTVPRPARWYPYGDGQLYREPNGAIGVAAGGFIAGFETMDELTANGYLGLPFVSVDAGTLAALPTSPRSGTLVRNALNGAIYIIAGGAKYVLTWNEYVALGYPAFVNIPVRHINRFGSVPAVGTILRDPSNGGIYQVQSFPQAESGRALNHLTPAEYAALKWPPFANVPPAWIGQFLIVA